MLDGVIEKAQNGLRLMLFLVEANLSCFLDVRLRAVIFLSYEVVILHEGVLHSFVVARCVPKARCILVLFLRSFVSDRRQTS